MQKANPIQIGGHFEDMLDLQIGSDAFTSQLGIKHKEISLDEYYKFWINVKDEQVKERVKAYRATFEITDDFKKDILNKAARGEISLRAVMEKYNSSAFGLNFLKLCNDSRIAEPMHVAGSVMMSEGFGYAGEGDWVTAAFVYAMQQAFGIASFSEIFSVGYADNRLVLKHWGEGNFAMARAKPKLLSSEFVDINRAEFAIVDFEFEISQATLLNLNSTPDGCGQIITITGEIIKDNLPKTSGPRAVFKPDCQDVRKLLTDYAYNGGSHHLALVKDNGSVVAEKICRLTGWKYIKL
jgi:L-arabinose isomerase